MSCKIPIIAFSWLTLLCFWIVSLYIYKPSSQIRRDKNWILFLISVISITFTTAYLVGEHLLKSFDLSTLSAYISDLIGGVLLLSGLSFAIWARMRLGRFWSASVSMIENQPIIKSGPYAVIRHPIYTGIIAMLWGSFLLERVGFILFIAVLGTLFLLWKARFEEAMLIRHKGEEYLYYKKQV